MKARSLLAASLSALSCLALLASAPAAASEHWPQFRGPGGDGIAPSAENLPVEFDDSKHLFWKTELPGRGWSSPVFDGRSLWVTTAIEVFPTEEERIARLKADGEEERTFAARQVASAIDLAVLQIDYETGELLDKIELVSIESPQTIHAQNSFASPTPVLSDGLLIAHFGTFGTFAIDTASNELVWDLTIDLEHGVGPGSSPFIYEDLVVLVCDGVDRQFVTALDKRTGETVWHTYRPEMRAPLGDQKKSYNTPILLTDASGREQLVCMSSQWLVSYDPKSGEEIWRFDHGDGFSVVPRPVFSEELQLLYFCTGFSGGELIAIQVDGEGDITDKDKVAWRESSRIPNKPSPLLVGDRIYVIADGGVGSCLDAATGEILWTERIDGNYSASPLLADGKIYLANHEGVVNVIAPSDTLEVLAMNQLEGAIMASPIALGSSLVIRSSEAIYRFSKETE